MGWKLISAPKTTKATKALAIEFAEMEPAPQDRPLSERRLQVYERLLRAGEFRPVAWASAECRETHETYRVNGKHTSVLLSRQEPVPELYIIVERYACDTLEDVAKLYSTYDSKLSSRTTADINRAFAAAVPELAGVAQSNLNLCASAISYCDLQEKTYRLQPQERAENLLEHHEFVLWIQDLFGTRRGNSKYNHLARMAVYAAMFGCYRRDKDAATKFWTAVRDETGTAPDTPDRKVGRYLLGVRTGRDATGRTIGHSYRSTVNDRQVFCKCIHGWNAWRKNESTVLKYTETDDIPKFR
jgi:hypothetical protein